MPVTLEQALDRSHLAGSRDRLSEESIELAVIEKLAPLVGNVRLEQIPQDEADRKDTPQVDRVLVYCSNMSSSPPQSAQSRVDAMRNAPQKRDRSWDVSLIIQTLSYSQESKNGRELMEIARESLDGWALNPKATAFVTGAGWRRTDGELWTHSVDLQIQETIVIGRGA